MKKGCLALAMALLCPCFVAAQAGPDYYSLVGQGNSQLQAGANDAALAKANSAIKVAPTRWQAYALAGGALLNLKRYEEAADDFSEAIKRAPEAKQPALRDLRRRCFMAEAGASPSHAGVTPTDQPAPAAVTQPEIVLWKTIENSNNREDFETYLRSYPNGAFAPLARRQLEKFRQQAELAAKRQEAAQAEYVMAAKNAQQISQYLSRFPTGEHAEAIAALFPQSILAMLANQQIMATASPNSPCEVTIRNIWVDEGLGRVKKAFASNHVIFDSATINFASPGPDLVSWRREVPQSFPALQTETLHGHIPYDIAAPIDFVKIDANGTKRIDVQLKGTSAHGQAAAKDVLAVTPDDCAIVGETVERCEIHSIASLLLPVYDGRAYAQSLQQFAKMCRDGRFRRTPNSPST